MYISKISVYQYVNCRGAKVKPSTLKSGEKSVKQQAKKELEMIKDQGKKAGTDSAWWRNEFREAVDVLEKIANGEAPSKPENLNSHSSLLDFHDFGGDGFI